MLSRPSRKRAHEPDDDRGGGGGNGDNVKVVVRIRPENERERTGNFGIVVQAVDENVLVFDPKEPSSGDYGSRKRPRDIRKRRSKDLKFAFDRVFGPEAENTDIYNETTNSVLTGLLNGYNCSVFAYGATGAGKTYTMLGSKEKPGVMYHTMMDLYSRIESMKDQKTCEIAVSYLEVYNEQIRDLLMPGQALPVREDPSAGVVIPGLSLHKPKNAEEILYMLQFGNQHRTQHPTDANAESSRSHAVFQVFVRQRDRTANISAEVRIAKLCLVDLAGSERATVTKNKGSRFREGANINRSLLALGNVINALAENKRKGFVPYRDSKLTRLLKDSLGGNCQTVMIAAVSPSSMTFEDTYNTLRYADRAKHIKATLKKNVLNVDFHVAKYGKIVEELRKEIVELKGKLQQAESRPATHPASSQSPHTEMPSFVGYQNDLLQYFSGHQAVRSKQLQEEITLRNLQWTMYRKERCLARLNALQKPQTSEYVTSVQNQLSLLRQKSSCLEITSSSSRSKLEESCKQLHNLESKMAAVRGKDKQLPEKSSCLEITSSSSRSKLEESCKQLHNLESKMAAVRGKDKQLPEVLSQLGQIGTLKCEAQDLRLYVTFTKQVIRSQERELIHNERLMQQLLQLLQQQHILLQANGLMTSDLQGQYENVERGASGQEVRWQDLQGSTGYFRDYTLQTMLELPALGLKPTWSDPASLKSPYSSQLGSSDTHQPRETLHKTPNKRGPAEGAPEVFQFHGNPASCQSQRPFQDLQVDECSPPKPKRILLPTKEPRHHGHSFRQRHNSNNRQSLESRNVNKMRTFNSASNLGMHRNDTKVKQQSSSSESSPENDLPTNTKFSKVFDTITKSKKFSHLHTAPTQQSSNSENLNETFTMDETYSCEATVSNGKITQLNCPVIEGSQCVGQCTVGSSMSAVSTSKRHSSGEPAAENECRCTQSVPQTGSKSDVIHTYGPENDSGTSTIVNQSSSSQSSLVSLSTIVDGQNDLSQNLSTDDCKEVESCVSRPVVHSSDTPDTAGSQPTEGPQKHAVRSIKFDNNENRDTPVKGKSYADALSMPSPERPLVQQVIDQDPSVQQSPNRPPLRQVGDSNRPVRVSDQSRQQKLNKVRDQIQSYRRGSGDLKENSQRLDRLGLPSLMDLGFNQDKKTLKKNQSMTPGYMQMTKSHAQRKNVDVARSRMRSKSVSNLATRSAWQF